MTVPTLGVVVATHNGATYLAEQLRSILDGDPAPDHVVVSDDASADATVEIARGLLETSGVPHVVLQRPEPLGVGANFFAGLAASPAAVVVLADQDDRWRPGRLRAVAEAFPPAHLVLAHGDAALVDAQGGELGATLFGRLEVRERELADIESGRGFEVYLRRNLATGATMAVRTAAFAGVPPPPDGWIHDEWLAIVASTRGRIAIERRPLIDYRQHGENQIGVAEPTLARKLRRVLAAEPGRNERLAIRAAGLADYLGEAGAEPRLVALATEKRDFETRRARLPRTRVLRVPALLRLLASGGYRRFASQGRLDALRDLLQPR